MRGARGLLSLVLSLVLAGCVGPAGREPDASWSEIEIAAPSQAVLFKLALLTVEGQGYPIAAGTDRGSGAIETGWRTNLQPFQGAGYRLRAVLDIAPVEERRFRVRARVQKQANEAIVAPLDPTRAEWKWREDDVSRAQVLLQHVRSALEGTEAGS
jgi:hypothetical protein